MLTNVGLSWLNLGIGAERWGCQHPSICPYDAFGTKDLYLVCGATNDAQFARLCKLLCLDWTVTDEHFATNTKRVESRDTLTPIFNEIFGTKTTDKWIAIFEGKGLPSVPINDIASAGEGDGDDWSNANGRPKQRTNRLYWGRYCSLDPLDQ
jgi:succinate--hydroxymethylglutarate CoA-transferase